MTHPICAADDCDRPRTRGKLCYRCNRELAHEINPCKHPKCDNGVWRDPYCGYHDHGIDWAAGDWYDEIAVERVWTGHRDTTRMPTVPEVRELLARADRTETPYAELAERLGITRDTFERWRLTLSKLDTPEAAA